ncbi:MAG: hypothetical protein GY821_07635 [Gammaproteobacteria bacterium]|nr:hypothetical protein [Gammaproteobacteria bacterium]
MKPNRGIKFLPNNASYDKMDSPVGELTIITSAEGLHAILWDVDCEAPACEKTIHELHHSAQEKTIVQTKKQLKEYLA